MVIIVQNVGKFFFPHRKVLELHKENYSPDLLRKITHAGAHSSISFEEAQESLEILAEVSISDSHIQRLTIRMGEEFNYQESQSTDLLEEVEEETDPIEVASVSIDGGRAQTRQEGCGAGTHNPEWLETKVSCMQILESVESEDDPHPQIPRIFLDKRSVRHMVEGLRGKGDQKKQERINEEKSQNSVEEDQTEGESTYAPKVVKRFATATVSEAEPFGVLVYNKANQKQLHTAKRKAYIGDGDRKIWTIYEDNFKPLGWVPILDFIHSVEYAWDAAKLSTENESHCWNKYVELVTHIWQGRVLAVIRKLDKTIKELESSKKTKNIEERIEKLKSIRDYFRNNYTKMNYPEYRKKGLPVSSCHVESLIKQFNHRVKSSEKFWNKTSLRGILKIKAALLSDDNSWEEFWNNRYELQTRSKRTYVKMAA